MRALTTEVSGAQNPQAAQANVRGHGGNTWAEPCGRDMKADAPETGGS